MIKEIQTQVHSLKTFYTPIKIIIQEVLKNFIRKIRMHSFIIRIFTFDIFNKCKRLEIIWRNRRKLT
jgi:hypothetical protein